MRKEILALAIAEIGYKETGVNITKFGEEFGLQGAWCGMFISIICLHAGHKLKSVGWPKGFCSVSAAYKEYAYAITKSPKAGDLVIIDYQRDSAADHVAMFIGWIDQTAGTFVTIEGNISDQVKIMIRSTAVVSDFIDLEKILA